MARSETTIMREIRDALNATGRCRLVRNAVGFDAVNRQRYGLVGSPDLWGVLKGGQCFAVEVKTPIGRLSNDQKRWWTAARRWGIQGGTARSVEEAMSLLDEAERQQK